METLSEILGVKELDREFRNHLFSFRKKLAAAKKAKNKKAVQKLVMEAEKITLNSLPLVSAVNSYRSVICETQKRVDAIKVGSKRKIKKVR